MMMREGQRKIHDWALSTGLWSECKVERGQASCLCSAMAPPTEWLARNVSKNVGDDDSSGLDDGMNDDANEGLPFSW